MLDVVATAALQHVQRADDVSDDIGMRILHLLPAPCLGAEMNDPLRPCSGEEPLHSGASQLVEDEPTSDYVVIGIAIIEADDLIAASSA